jgi:hypothetical protein
LEITDTRGGYFESADTVSAAGEIESGRRETIVHGHQEIARAENSAFRAKGFLHGFTERNADIFDSVVLVNVEIAASGELEIQASVARDLFEHVIEETDAGAYFGFAAPVEI